MSEGPAKICIVCRREFPAQFVECPDDRVRLSEKDVRIGTVFDGKYEVLDFVGAGGISRVYKARHKELNRIVALKLLKMSRQIDLQRFKREAISVGQLQHPNIARVYSLSVSADGNAYIAMEYLEGRDLAEILSRDGSLSAREAIEVFEQVASALEHAHQHQIIHRDIKPGNIIVLDNPEEDSSVKVVDFGMARIQPQTGELQKLTLDGEIIGTRRYISPEQYRGGKADERADVYSLGISLYEAVMVNGQLPDELSPIISKATEVDPSNRYQTAAELKEALSAVRESVLASPDLKKAKSKPTERDFFGTFFFWSMISGMVVIGLLALIVIKQRLTTLEALSTNPEKPLTRQGNPLSFEANQNRARELVSKGKLEDAIKLYLSWCRRKSNADKPEQMCQAQIRLAELYLRCSNLQAAQESLTLGLELSRKHKIVGISYLNLLSGLASLDFARADYNKSVADAKEALNYIASSHMAHEELSKLPFIYTIGRSKLRLGELDEAESYMKQGLRIAKDSLGPDSLPYAEGCMGMSELMKRKKDLDGAYEFAQNAVNAYKHNNLSDSIQGLQAMASKDVIAAKLGYRDEVEQDYDLLSKKIDKAVLDHPALMRTLRIEMSELALFLDRKEELSKWEPGSAKETAGSEQVR